MPKKTHAHSIRLRGKVVAFNVSPKGHIEGALMKTSDGTAQVNFPKHAADDLARSMRVGGTVDLAVELETDEFDHVVYVAAETDGAAKITEKIARLNYALHGEVNGFHLDDGTFVHLKPEGAKKLRPRVGEIVTASGTRRTGTAAVVLEATGVERARKPAHDSARA